MHSRRRKKRALVQPPTALQLTSLMDVLTTLLFFLLQNYSAEAPYNPSKDLRIPNSTSRQNIKNTTKIVASRSGVSVGTVKVASICNNQLYLPEVECDPKTGSPNQTGKEIKDLVIPSLQKALRDEAEALKVIAAQRKEKPFEGHLILEADQMLPYKILRVIMFTAGQSEFGLFKFAVKRKES